MSGPFAGETEADHQELLQFCRDFKFERMGAFAYSEEDGTPAASYPDQVLMQIIFGMYAVKGGLHALFSQKPSYRCRCVPGMQNHKRCVFRGCLCWLQVADEVRQARRDELVSQQQQISTDFAESLVGTEVRMRLLPSPHRAPYLLPCAMVVAYFARSPIHTSRSYTCWVFVHASRGFVMPCCRWMFWWRASTRMGSSVGAASMTPQVIQ